MESRETATSALTYNERRNRDSVKLHLWKIAALVRLGLEGQENRKREFFQRLKENLSNNDPKQQDLLIEEFRALILGR